MSIGFEPYFTPKNDQKIMNSSYFNLFQVPQAA